MGDKYNKRCFAKVSTMILFVSTLSSGPVSILLNPIRWKLSVKHKVLNKS